MRKVTQIVFAALTVVTLGTLAEIPLFAAWRMPAGRVENPAQVGGAVLLVAAFGQRTIAARQVASASS
jgi:hypothetical protein